MKKHIIKRHISFFLAVVLLLGALPQLTAYAAPATSVQFKIENTRSLTYGNLTPHPILRPTTPTGDNEVFISWGMPANESRFSYELFFPLNNNEVGRLTVMRDSTSVPPRALVTFHLENGTEGATTTGVQPNPSGLTATHYIKPSYMIYSNLAGGDFIPIRRYIESINAPTDHYRSRTNANGDYIVNTDPSLIVTPGDATATPAIPDVTLADFGVSRAYYTTGGPTGDFYPSFNLTQDTGVTFKYDIYEIKVLWSGSEFCFMIDGIEKDRIYEYTFTKWQTNSSGVVISSLQDSKILQFTGFSEDNIESQPYANAVNPEDDAAADLNPQSGGRTNAVSQLIDMDATNHLIPGEDRVDLRITFTMPEIWNFAAKEFVPFATGLSLLENSDYSCNTSGVLSLSGTTTVTVEITDFLSNNPSIQTHRWGSDKDPKPQVRYNNGEVILYLYGLSYSYYFTSGRVDVTGVPTDTTSDLPVNNIGFNAKSTRIGAGVVYTYIKYDFNTSDNTIVFYPYRVGGTTSGSLTGQPGSYILYMAIASPPTESSLNNNPVQTIRYEGTGNEETLTFELPMEIAARLGGAHGYFRIAFNGDTTHDIGAAPADDDLIKSQTIKVTPEFKSYISLPEAFKATVYSMTLKPGTSTIDEISDLFLDLEWDLGSEAQIKAYFDDPTNTGPLTVVYRFSRAESPDETNPLQFIEIEVEVTRRTPSATIPGAFDYWVRYPGYTSLDNKAALFASLGRGNNPAVNEDFAGTEMPLYLQNGRYFARVRIKTEAFLRNDTPFGVGETFRYPSVYFLAAKPISVNGDTIDFGISEYSSITLNEISPRDIPPPGNLKAANPYIDDREDITDRPEASFNLSWELSGSTLKTYLRKKVPEDAAGNVDLSVITEANMTVYISTKETLMNDDDFKDFPLKNLGQRRSDYIEVVPYDWWPEPTPIAPTTTSTSARRVYLSDLPEVKGSVLDPTAVHFDAARDELRAGKIIAITGIPLGEDDIAADGSVIPLSFLKELYDNGDAPGAAGHNPMKYSLIIDGLDPNEIYFAYADLNIEIDGDDPALKVSQLSNLASVTMTNDIQAPTGKDKVPPAPQVTINPAADVKSNEVIVHWTQVQDDETIEYEILRIKQELPAALLNATKHPDYEFAEVWDALPASAAADAQLGLRTVTDFTTYPKGYFLFYPDFSQNADLTKYVPGLDTDPMTLTDKTVLPNQIYYYYVRTVKTTSDGLILYSVWARATATTDTVTPPINLFINNTVEIDREREVVIEFDAPFTFAQLQAGDFSLEYQMRKETEPWGAPVKMDLASILSVSIRPVAGAAGYYHYVYKIAGLEPNTGYQIRVRAKDANGDTSQWSNIADFKTDFNQGDYDKKHETDEWLKRLRELLERLLREPYWVLNSSNTQWEVAYRPDRFAALIKSAVGASVALAPSETDKQTYYIPASALAEANRANKGFIITRGDMEVIISPNAINEVYNDSVIDINNDIKKSAAADYYLKINVDWADTGGKINGDNPLSKQATVSMDIVGEAKKITAIDAEIYAELSIMLESLLDNKQVYAQVMRNVESGMTDTDFVKYIESIVSGMRKDIYTVAGSKITGAAKRAAPVTSLGKPLIVTVSKLDPMASVLGYTFVNGAWVPTQAVVMGNKIGLYSSAPGTFIFAGRVIRIDGIEEMKNGGNIGGVAGKHGLDDFLGADGVIDMNVPATRFMVVSSIARMAGAPRGANAYSWLKDNLGITISSRSDNNAIQTQEAVYLSMLLYEAKTKKKISTMKIRNQNATANIQGINDNYKPYIKAAFETGVYNNPAMNPKGGITIKDFFEMLGRLDTMLKL